MSSINCPQPFWGVGGGGGGGGGAVTCDIADIVVLMSQHIDFSCG